MEVYCLFMMRKKEKVITMTVTLILVVILICIKVTHFVIIERPLKQCRIVSAYHLTVDTNGAQIDQSWLFEKDDLTYIDIAKTFEQTYFVTDYAGGSGDSGALNELTIAFGETMDGMPDMQPCRWASKRFRTVILWMRQAHSHSSGNSTDEAV